MNDDICSLLDESIKLELNVSGLYTLFNRLFPNDTDLWWGLVLEEHNHAALIRSGKEHFKPIDKFPQDMLHRNLQELKDANAKLRSLIADVESSCLKGDSVEYRLEDRAVGR